MGVVLKKTNSLSVVSILILNCVVLIFVGECHAHEKYHGRVVAIIDGDSLVVERRGKKLETRLYGIDAPEWGQPHAELAKRYLEKRALGGKALVSVLYQDKYDRDIAIVHVGRENLNLNLVGNGYAWVHPFFCKKKICVEWRVAEKKARKAGKGLWQERKPTPPWKWKRK